HSSDFGGDTVGNTHGLGRGEGPFDIDRATAYTGMFTSNNACGSDEHRLARFDSFITGDVVRVARDDCEIHASLLELGRHGLRYVQEAKVISFRSIIAAVAGSPRVHDMGNFGTCLSQLLEQLKEVLNRFRIDLVLVIRVADIAGTSIDENYPLSFC